MVAFRKSAKKEPSSLNSKHDRHKGVITSLRNIFSFRAETGEKLNSKRKKMVKIKPWLFPGTINVHGCYSVPSYRSGRNTVLRLPPSGKKPAVTIKINTGKNRVVKAFMHQESGRVIYITRLGEKKNITKKDKKNKIIKNDCVRVSYDAWHFFPEKGDRAGSLFLSTHFNYFPKQQWVIGGKFSWIDKGKTAGATKPPNWIAGKGFGLFVDFLRDLEHQKDGVKKIFGYIDQQAASIDFAEKRGFRNLTKKEKRQLGEAGYWGINPGQPIKLMVRDFSLN